MVFFFCLGDCGGFLDAVEEVSVLMNGDVEKGKKNKIKIKTKKEEKKRKILHYLFHFLLRGVLNSKSGC